MYVLLNSFVLLKRVTVFKLSTGHVSHLVLTSKWCLGVCGKESAEVELEVFQGALPRLYSPDTFPAGVSQQNHMSCVRFGRADCDLHKRGWIFLQKIFLFKYFLLYCHTRSNLLLSVIFLKLSFHVDLIVTAGGQSQSWHVFCSHQT